MVSHPNSAVSLRPLLEECGYTGARLAVNYKLGNVALPLVGFASRERDMDSACIAVVDGGDNPEKAVRSCYELAAPVVWVLNNETVDWWIQRKEKPEQFNPSPLNHNAFASFVRERKDQLNPISIYQGRTLGRIDSAKQLDFVDVGLLPLMREEAGKKLHDIVESMLSATLKSMPRSNPSKETVHDVFTSIFRLLAGKILADKKIGKFSSIDLSKPKDVLEAVAMHYDPTNTKLPPPVSGYAVLKDAANLLADTGSFAVVSPESLAYVYEHTLVSTDLRKKLGIHATPPWLVDYMVWQLYDWVREIPIEDRHVFEPACGHAPFLLSMMRLLRMEMHGKTDKAVHTYLKNHIHGVEIDDFAREIARLSLTLADIPNPNGWDLMAGDMYASDILKREAQRCRILLSNPPYAKFNATEKKRCDDKGYGVAYKKAVELITRTINQLPAGAVFGLVVPQTVVSGPEANHIRKFLLEECELAEICCFPGKVFKFAQIETAIVLGRRNTPSGSSLAHCVRLRTVGERGMAAFKHNYQVDENELVTQVSLRSHPTLELKVPSLYEVWKVLENNPRIRDLSDIGRGIEYKGEDTRKGRPVVSDSQRTGFEPGYAGVSRTQTVFSAPPECWLAVDPTIIGNPRQGKATGDPQILVNMGRTSRFRWRLKPLLDMSGRHVKNNFAIIRPHQREDALYFWAVLNSPLANAFVASRTMRKHNYEGILGDIPLPKNYIHSYNEIVQAASTYRDIAVKREVELVRQKDSSLFDEAEPETPAIPESLVCEALLHLDVAVVCAYALPSRLERQLLKYFNGSQRTGVGCSSGDYDLASFKLHKRDFISKKRISTQMMVETVDRVEPRQLSKIHDDLKADVAAFSKFEQLANEWHKNRPRGADIADMINHPAYQKIIDMGESAIRPILECLLEKPEHWFWALHVITSENPVPPDSEGVLRKMADAWIAWGRERGYIA